MTQMRVMKLEDFKCRVTGRPSAEMEDCGCRECSDHKTQIQLMSYMAEQQVKLAEKARRIIARHKFLPQSATCYFDINQLYVWTAETMLLRLCKALQMPPSMVTLTPASDLQGPPGVDFAVKEWWVKSQFKEQFEKMKPMDMRALLDDHCRGHVAVESDKFMAEWKKVCIAVGYIDEQQDPDSAAN
jgi:hypothetical protein